MRAAETYRRCFWLVNLLQALVVSHHSVSRAAHGTRSEPHRSLARHTRKASRQCDGAKLAVAPLLTAHGVLCKHDCSTQVLPALLSPPLSSAPHPATNFAIPSPEKTPWLTIGLSSRYTFRQSLFASQRYAPRMRQSSHRPLLPLPTQVLDPSTWDQRSRCTNIGGERQLECAIDQAPVLPVSPCVPRPTQRSQQRHRHVAGRSCAVLLQSSILASLGMLRPAIHELIGQAFFALHYLLWPFNRPCRF